MGRSSTITADDEELRSAPGLSGTRAFGGHQPALDGIRGLAVAGTVAYHAGLPGVEGAYLGVSLFFTLSGFLITGLLLNERRGSPQLDLGRFWSRRFRRLAPAAMVGVALALVYSALAGTRGQLERLPEHVAGSVFYVVNWVFVGTEESYADVFSAPSPLQHYWSLAIEEQFYVILPLVLMVVLRARLAPVRLTVVLGGLAVASSLWMAWLYADGASLARLYYGTDTRIAEILVGALLAVALDHVGIAAIEPWRKAAASAGVVATAALLWMWNAVSLDGSFVFRGGFALHAILTAILIASVLVPKTPIRRLFSLPPLVWLGQISYGIYIYHWVVFLWLTEERTGLPEWPLFALRMAVSVALAVVSYRLVERPIRDGALSGRGRYIILPLLATVLVGAAAAVSTIDAADPLATLRGDENALFASSADGQLDLLFVHAAGARTIVDAVQDRVDEIADVRMSVHPLDPMLDWAAIVAESDPDTVVVFADEWVPADAANLAPEAQEDAARTGLETLVEQWTAQGATVVWARSGGGFAELFTRSRRPITVVMNGLEAERDDVFVMQGSRLPDPANFTQAAYPQELARAIVDDAALYQRGTNQDLRRLLIVGDSQARSLGYGLERWGSENSIARVWNVAVPGCGLADEGWVGDPPLPVTDVCREVTSNLERQIAGFDPDVVIVLTGLWDLAPRRFEESGDLRSIGDEVFDDYLRREFNEAVDRLSAAGAQVVWMTAPCVEFDIAHLRAGSELDVFNDEILGSVADRPEVVVWPLADILCPDGRPLQQVDDIDPVRVDGVHFSVDAALWFAALYGPDIIDGRKPGE